MRKISYPRMEILQSLYELTADISENRFVTTRPNAVGDGMEDFLLIRIPQTIYDRGDTYQTTTGQIICFVRDIQGSDADGNTISGMENTLRLEQMQSEVLNLFPIVEKRYHAKFPKLLPGGSDGTGFHSLIIQFSIIILKQS